MLRVEQVEALRHVALGRALGRVAVGAGGRHRLDAAGGAHREHGAEGHRQHAMHGAQVAGRQMRRADAGEHAADHGRRRARARSALDAASASWEISGLTLRTKLRHRLPARIGTIPSHEHRHRCSTRRTRRRCRAPARCRRAPPNCRRRSATSTTRASSRGCRRWRERRRARPPSGRDRGRRTGRHGARARPGQPRRASVILEADDTVCVGSRAACISRRSLEIIERLGALPAFLAKGLPWTGGRSFYKTDEVFRFEMPHDDRAEAAADDQPRAVLHRAVPAGRDRAPQRTRARH